MIFRSLFILGFAILPFTAIADQSSSLDQAQSPQSPVGASYILPQTGTGSGPSPTGAAVLLQPGATALQGSATDGASLSAPTEPALQAPPADSNLQVMLNGEADGPPHPLGDDLSSIGETMSIIAAGVLVLCVTIFFLRRRVVATDTTREAKLEA